ncbi:MAG: UDP-N-acetylmuramate--L-alanine ligase [Prevotellaceae bacterium]|jgi:UDP-N-acetylmuramate--alanine ligase|nr:UDP-N-acetylmuramate--L-alanine ligase [Prevotellaceae bacterium]
MNGTAAKHIYFIGIGGIGMSALARYFLHERWQVAGYDRTRTPLTQALEREGISVHYEDSAELIPDAFKANAAATLVVYTPAVEDDNRERDFFARCGAQVLKRSEMLGRVAHGKKLLAVAGTHGKTTTSTMLAHLLTQAGGGCSAFLGGISKNYGTNLLLADSELLVAEADEYDRSFLQLFPDVAVVTSMDADHLDIYGSHEALQRAFRSFVAQLKPQGALVAKKSLVRDGKLPAALPDGRRVYTYAFDEQADFYARNVRPTGGGYFSFDIAAAGQLITGCTVGAPGWVNVENAVAATAAAVAAGVDCRGLPQALRSFQGVQRRLDVRLHTPALTYIDDYAHHPEELRAAITSIRGMFPSEKITGIFQPHLYSRTRDFAVGFAESLALLDELLLLDVYPARELPIAGVTSAIIFDRVGISSKALCRKEDVLGLLRGRDLQVLVTLGAGDIDTLVEPIADYLLNEVKQEATCAKR